MKKLGLFLVLVLIVFHLFSQSETRENNKTCLFGYISSNPDDFDNVISFIEGMGVKVISSCEKEKLIFVKLNRSMKEYNDLFDEIESNFEGKCYFKSTINKIPEYDKCKEKYIKKQ